MMTNVRSVVVGVVQAVVSTSGRSPDGFTSEVVPSQPVHWFGRLGRSDDETVEHLAPLYRALHPDVRRRLMEDLQAARARLAEEDV